MTDPADEATRDERAPEIQLGIDLRARAERLIAAAEAFAGSARVLMRLAFWAGLVSVLVLIAIAALFVEVQVSLSNAQDTRNRIVSCVEPAGACYQRGQQQTGTAIGSINLYAAWTAACAVEDSIARLPLTERGPAVAKCAAAHIPKAGN